MAADFIKTSLRMAAPAAILVLLPGIAAAANSACNDMYRQITFVGRLFPGIEEWIAADPDRAQLRSLMQPDTWITGALLIWLIFSNTTASTIAAAAWFACLAIYYTFVYFSTDANPALQEAIAMGCLDVSPYRIFTNLAFAAVALLLTWQRMRRQKSG